VPGGFNLFPLQRLVFIPEESRDITVSGTIKEIRGGTFDLYVFNKRNYDLWVAKASYKAFMDAKDISSTAVNFSPTREDVMNALYFVAVNKNPFGGPDISVEYSIKISWNEKSYAHVLGGLVLGGLLGGLGFLLIIVSAVAKVVFQRQEKEKTYQPIAPMAPVAAVPEVKARYCSECGTALTPIGAAGRSLCSKCKRIYD